MAIPKTVQRQLEQAEALQAQVAAEPETPEPIETTAQITAQQPAETPPQAPPTPAPPADTTDWRSKFLSLQGLFNQQVPALQADQKVKDSQIASLMEQVNALKAQVATVTRPQEPAKPALDPRDVDQFGEAMMEMLHRHIKGASQSLMAQVGSAINGLDQRLKALEGSVQGVAKRTEESLEAQFWSALSKAHPDYDAIDATDGWKAWLAQVDRFTGVQRQQLLLKAQKDLDADRVSEFFTAYKATLPKPASAELSRHVSPSTGGTAAAPQAAPASRIYTEKFIQSFYTELVTGKWKGREAEAERIKADIDQAAAEGRIRR